MGPCAPIGPPWTEGDEPQGRRLRWRACGSGPPVVCLHKLGGWISEWARLAPLLEGRRVIAMDLPGHGGGDEPAPWAQDITDSGTRVLETLDAIGLRDFSLIGTSHGGSVAVILAGEHPARVSALALISVALTGPAPIDEVRVTDAKGDGVLYGPGDEPIARPFAYMAEQFGFFDHAVADDMNRSRAAAGRWVRASWRGVYLADVRGRLPKITAPTLLMFGELGGANYAKHEATGLALLREARAVTIAGGSSFPHEDQPQRTAAALNGFLPK